jgi:hypothetical protein
LRETSQVDFSAFPTKALHEIPKTKKSGGRKLGESITAFSGRKQVLEVLFFYFSGIMPSQTAIPSRRSLQTRIDEFFCFEYYPFRFLGGPLKC